MMGELRRVIGLAGTPRAGVALSVMLGTLTILFGVGLLAASGYLVSRAAEQPPILSLTVTIVLVRFFGLGRPVVRYLDRLFSHDLALRSLGTIRSAFYARIEPLAPGELESFRRGDLVSRMVADVDALQGLFLRALAAPLAAVVVSVVCVAVVATVLPFAGLVLLLGLILAGIAVPAATARLGRGAGERQAGARGSLTADLVEVLRGAPELVVYGRGADRLAAIRVSDRELSRIGRRGALVAGLGEGLFVAVLGLTVAGVLAAAVHAHAGGSLDRVLIATLALLAIASFEAVAPLPGAARELSEALGAGGRVLEIVDRNPRVCDPRTPRPLSLGPVTVALESVTARYAPDEAPVLEGVDLLIPPGSRIALVGPSGSGKTTVTNLLFRFLDPETGRVTVNGVDIRELRLHDVRATFALAGQEAHVFNSTIRENLLLGRPLATDAELTDVLTRVRLDAWVSSLPERLETFVGEEGARLSGGQRQRLVLARALLLDAPVLVLDEPTAHLDPETASELVHDVFASVKDRSILLITHRAEGLDLVDEVVVLDGGRVVERQLRARH